MDRSTVVMVLVSALVFAGVLTTINMMYWGWRSQQASKAEALAKRLGTAEVSSTSVLFREQNADPWTDALGSMGRRLESLLQQAGSDWTMGRLLGYSTALAIIGASFTFTIFKGPIGIVGAGFGVFPILIISSRAEERAR